MLPTKAAAKPSPAQKLRSILTSTGSSSTAAGASATEDKDCCAGAAAASAAAAALPHTNTSSPPSPPSLHPVTVPSPAHPPSTAIAPADTKRDVAPTPTSTGGDDGYTTPNDHANTTSATTTTSYSGPGLAAEIDKRDRHRQRSASTNRRRRRQHARGRVPTHDYSPFASSTSMIARRNHDPAPASAPSSPMAYQDVLVSDEEDLVFEDDYEGDREDEVTKADRAWDGPISARKSKAPGMALRGRHRRSRSSGQVGSPSNDTETVAGQPADTSAHKPGGGTGSGSHNRTSGPPLIRYIRSWGANNKLEEPDCSASDIPVGRPDGGAAIATAEADKAARPGPYRSYGTPEEAEEDGGGDDCEDDDEGVVSENDLLVHDDDNDSSLSGGTDAGDDSDDDESSWSFSAACEGPRDWDFDTEWIEMPPLPHRFDLSLNRASAALPYLDPLMLHEKTQLLERESNRFAMEQGLFLQAVMQLLAERDQVGVEGSIHSGENIWKKGPLKKLSTAVIGGARMNKWKNKYVELRQGNLCYYEDSGPGRKTIHIRQSDTTVQESHGMGRGSSLTEYVFELCVQGSPTRYWMTSSEEERQAWIKAIQAAMVGGADGPRKVLDLTPHQQAIDAFKGIRERIESAMSKDEYLDAVVHADWLAQEDDALRVPVAWIREQIRQRESEKVGSQHRNSIHLASAQKQLKSSVSDFWTKMGRTTFAINGITLPCDSPRAPARVMGALTRAILEFDKAFASRDSAAVLKWEGELSPEEEDPSTAASVDGHITELQAAAYARNILMAVLRSEESQPAQATAQYLLQRPDLVSLASPAGDEHLVSIDVSFPGDELPDDFLPPVSDEMAGWVWIRRPKQPAKSGRRRYAVLSGSALSYYEHANPRPTGLRGQLLLNGASLKTRHDEPDVDGKLEFTVCTSREHDRVLSFDSEIDFLDWKEAIQAVIDSFSASCGPPMAVSSVIPEEDDCDGAVPGKPSECDSPAPAVRSATAAPPSRPAAGNALRRNAERVAQGVTERVIKGADGGIRGGIRVIKGAKDGGIKVIKTATDGSMKVLRGAVGRLPTDSSMKVIRGAVGRLRPSRSNAESGYDGRRSLSRRPSMQVLLNNTALSGKRDEPTVQCVVQSLRSFHVVSAKALGPSVNDGETWLSVSVRLYQAFLLMGGPSGRMAHGDALIELDFMESATLDALDF